MFITTPLHPHRRRLLAFLPPGVALPPNPGSAGGTVFDTLRGRTVNISFSQTVTLTVGAVGDGDVTGYVRFDGVERLSSTVPVEAQGWGA